MIEKLAAAGFTGSRAHLDIGHNPRYIIRLAQEGGFNGIVTQIGLAEKFYWDYAGEVPLVLKLNGKTDIPSDAQALSPINATVEDAVRLGADAVGYTLYVGTPVQDRDFEQYRAVRADALRLGMPLIVWAYPRGSAIEGKGGKRFLLRRGLCGPHCERTGRGRRQGEFSAPGKDQRGEGTLRR